MKKLFALMFIVFFSFAFVEEKFFLYREKTKDNCIIYFYNIDKDDIDNLGSYEFYVRVVSEISKEYFTWCFPYKNSAEKCFQSLKTYKFNSNREFWRSQSSDCQEANGGYINYWIQSGFDIEN